MDKTAFDDAIRADCWEELPTDPTQRLLRVTEELQTWDPQRLADHFYDLGLVHLFYYLRHLPPEEILQAVSYPILRNLYVAATHPRLTKTKGFKFRDHETAQIEKTLQTLARLHLDSIQKPKAAGIRAAS